MQALCCGAELLILLEAHSVGERFISVDFLGICVVLWLGF